MAQINQITKIPMQCVKYDKENFGNILVLKTFPATFRERKIKSFDEKYLLPSSGKSENDTFGSI